ncbi:MAG: Tn3 family transposase [Alphaproteobacteria bacterium]|nr:Tn3 family transposase [Alphaproteobacteria bacterium]
MASYLYMAEIIEQFKKEGGSVKEDDLKHLSPARHEHINPYGKYRFDLNTLQNGQLRPLRKKG